MTDNKALNEKQLAFCREYIVDFNQTQSAIRAGYSKKTAGAMASRLLKNVKVTAKIKELVEERAKRTGITADRVVEQLAKIAFLDIKDIVEWGVEGKKRAVGREKNDDGEVETVYETDYFEYLRPKNPDQVDGTLIQTVEIGKYGFKITIPDRMKAFEMLAKHLGVYDDRPQTTVDVSAYAKALWERANAGDIWTGFDNGGPDPEDDDNGKD